MKSPYIALTVAWSLVVGIAALSVAAAQADDAKPVAKKSPAAAPAHRVVACYFHRTNSCPTCQKISSYIEESLKTGFAKEMKAGSVDLPSVGRMLLEHLRPERFQELAAYIQSDPSHDFQGLVTDPRFGLGIPFMLFGVMLWGLCIAVYVGTSLLTPPPPRATVDGICWDHPLAFLRGRITGWSDPRVIALVLFVVVTFLYTIDRLFFY